MKKKKKNNEILTLDCVRLKHASTSAWPPQISIIDPIFTSNQICLKTLGHDRKMRMMCQIKGKSKLMCSNLGFQHQQEWQEGRERSWNSKC
jgi:hypothetical protein